MTVAAPREVVAVVTGASGFLGTEVTKELLDRGYTVRGTVRDPSNKAKVGHLEALGAALPGKLTLHAADLLQEGGFDEVAQGATFIFHTASPFLLTNEDPYRDLIDPAVKGTKNVMAAAAKQGVKRVVLTSSFAAIFKARSGPAKAGTYDEEDWNTDSKPEGDDAYSYSKVEAEKAAWAAAREAGLDLVVVNPTFIVGPVVSSRTDASSIQLVTGFIEGKEVGTIFPYHVDVRDVALAHIRAAEVAEAKGRYLVTNTHPLPTAGISAFLQKAFPQYAFPQGDSKPAMGAQDAIDNRKAQRELGFQLRPHHEMWVDMARSLIATGIAKPVSKQ